MSHFQYCHMRTLYHSDIESHQTLIPDKDAVEERHKVCVEVVHDYPRPGLDCWMRRQQRWVLLTCGKILCNVKVIHEIS